jgi:hypothetical protein
MVMLFFRKIFNDTLKFKGKYSRKNITILIAFSLTMLIGIYIVTADLIGVALSVYPIQVFDGLLVFVAAMMGITVADKKLNNDGDGTPPTIDNN